MRSTVLLPSLEAPALEALHPNLSSAHGMHTNRFGVGTYVEFKVPGKTPGTRPAVDPPGQWGSVAQKTYPSPTAHTCAHGA